MGKNNKKKLTIHQVFWYFIIFSILGLIIETIYCYSTMGILESRKGLIWGPFCPVYGVSAAVLLIFLDKYKNKNIIRIFAFGFIIGSIAEYILSYTLESIYGIRFWDYEYTKLSLNGRICLQYSTYWGVLSIILLKFIKPYIDKLINKIPTKTRNIIEIILFTYFVINSIFTVWGIQTYQNRVIYNKTAQRGNNIFSNIVYNIQENYFTNERISKTFPNLRIKNEKGEEVWIKTLIED